MPMSRRAGYPPEQITFDYLDTETGQVQRGQVSPADRAHLRAWLARFAGREDVAFAAEGCTGWRYVAAELATASVAAHLAAPADCGDERPRPPAATSRPTRPTAGSRGCCWPRTAGMLDPARQHPGMPRAAGDLP